MAGDKGKEKPTKAETAANLLRLGHLLHQYLNPPGRLFGLSRPLKAEEAEKLREEIAAVENRIEEAVHDSRQWLLRSVFGVRGQEVVDALAVRIVAYIAWSSLASERSDVGVARVSNAVSMGDWETHLEARRTIRVMIARETAIGIRDTECFGDTLHPNTRLIQFLSNDNLPVLYTAKSVQEERDEWELKQRGVAMKKVSRLPRSADASPSLPRPPEAPSLLTARGIYESLKDQVIALDGPLRRFSAQMSLHMRRLEQIRKGVRPSVGPIVTLLIGSSGSGKTWMAETFARISGLPYAVADMSCVSQTSYVGLGFDECFLGLLANNTKPQIAETGILVMDEFDKICAKGNGGHSSADAQGRGIQSEILKPWDGCRLPLGSRRSNVPSFGVIDTCHTCFVACGAFQGLRDLLADGNRKATGLGFGSAGAKAARSDIRDALVKYGFMEQITNRIGAIIVLSDPTPEQIVRITSHPGTGLLARQNAFLGSFGMSLDLTDEAIQYLANWACETRGYSRAVKTVLGTLVESHLYDDKPGDINVWLADVKWAINETEGAEGLQK